MNVALKTITWETPKFLSFKALSHDFLMFYLSVFEQFRLHTSKSVCEFYWLKVQEGLEASN